MYHMVRAKDSRCHENPPALGEIILRCLGAFVRAGTLDVSLDQLAGEVGMSKRMLIHYFGGRETIEERAMELLESRLRAQFAPNNFPQGISLQQVLAELWKQTTDPASKGVLLLTMDLSKRAWNGSSRAHRFYMEQQRLWVDLLMHYLPDKEAVEDILQSFQGAVLAYLITGETERGKRMLDRLSAQLQHHETSERSRKGSHSATRP
jgi:AcrR family transcriptional regulator